MLLRNNRSGSVLQYGGNDLYLFRWQRAERRRQPLLDVSSRSRHCIHCRRTVLLYASKNDILYYDASVLTRRAIVDIRSSFRRIVVVERYNDIFVRFASPNIR